MRELHIPKNENRFRLWALQPQPAPAGASHVSNARLPRSGRCRWHPLHFTGCYEIGQRFTAFIGLAVHYRCAAGTASGSSARTIVRHAGVKRFQWRR